MFLEELKIEYEGLMANGLISYEYFFEATRCWLDGQFIATIVMMQMAFEEGLRQVYRGFPSLDDEKILQKINKISFFELIEVAKKDEYITKWEAARLHTLREMRNPFVHVKRNNREKWRASGTSEVSIMLKISELYQEEMGMIDESTLEKEAKKALKFARLYYRIFSRMLVHSKTISIRGEQAKKPVLNRN